MSVVKAQHYQDIIYTNESVIGKVSHTQFVIATRLILKFTIADIYRGINIKVQRRGISASGMSSGSQMPF